MVWNYQFTRNPGSQLAGPNIIAGTRLLLCDGAVQVTLLRRQLRGAATSNGTGTRT